MWSDRRKYSAVTPSKWRAGGNRWLTLWRMTRFLIVSLSESSPGLFALSSTVGDHDILLPEIGERGVEYRSTPLETNNSYDGGAHLRRGSPTFPEVP